jgi:hypothetical protein
VRRSPSEIFDNDGLRDADIPQAPNSAPSATEKLCLFNKRRSYRAIGARQWQLKILELEQSGRRDLE